jgi:hypothetical protein
MVESARRDFFVHKFWNREKISFLILKSIPYVKDWSKKLCEQKETEEPFIIYSRSHLESFKDSIEEQYYPVGSYDDLAQKMDHVAIRKKPSGARVHKSLHTLRTKLGIKRF